MIYFTNVKFYLKEKMTKKLTILAIALSAVMYTHAQVKFTPDTMECHMISFSAGLAMPGSGSTNTGMTGGNMKDLYSGPYLDFSIGCDYKYKSNWMVTLDGDMWFGVTDDNLQDRRERIGDVFTPLGYPLTTNGTDGALQAYNRSLAVRIGVAKIIPVIHDNPNSGLMLKVSGGWMMQKTVFGQDWTKDPVPLLHDDYGKLFDHLRQGAIISEGIGFNYMSNYLTYVNFRIVFEVSQCISWSTRPYQIDNLMGLNGKDNNRYFDLMYSLRLTWMFPLTGKTTYDYYYY